MLKKVYAVRNNKENRLYHSNKGITYYQTKGNARNLRKKLIKKGIDPSELSVIGYMLMLIEIDDEGVKSE